MGNGLHSWTEKIILGEVNGDPLPGNALLFVKRFAGEGSSRWLTDELADALARRGIDVDVVVLDLRGGVTPSYAGRRPIRVRRYSVGRKPRAAGGLPRRAWGLAGVELRLHFGELARALRHPPDVVVVFSIASLFGLLPILLRRLGLARTLVFVLWDFFPDHHAAIGVVPRRTRRILRPLERWIARSADVVCAMSERNREVAVDYFGLSSERVIVQPPWGDALNGGDTRMSFPREGALHLVFGGQTGRGRDLGQLLESVVDARQEGLPLRISIIGTLPRNLDDVVARCPAGQDAIEVVPWMTRDAYLDYIRNADVGVVVTDRRVQFPTFPSKLVDYFRVGLPVLACLEGASDVGDIVEGRELGLACDLWKPGDFSARISELLELRRVGQLERYSRNAQDYFDAEMESSVAANRILDAVRNARKSPPK